MIHSNNFLFETTRIGSADGIDRFRPEIKVSRRFFGAQFVNHRIQYIHSIPDRQETGWKNEEGKPVGPPAVSPLCPDRSPGGGQTPVGTTFRAVPNFTSSIFNFSSCPFSCFAQEKGPKRRAPLKRRGAAFPRTASVETTGDVALKPLQAFPDDVAERTRAEKPLPHRRTRDRNLQSTVRRCSCALERLQTPHPHRRPTP